MAKLCIEFSRRLSAGFSDLTYTDKQSPMMTFSEVYQI